MRLLTYASLVLTMLLWGGTFIAGRMLAGVLEPENAAFLRFFIASIALLVVLSLTERRIRRPPMKSWIALFLLGLTGVFAYNVFFFYGLNHISAGRAALIIASTPLVITILAAIFLSERLTTLKITGVLTSLTGALVVISNGQPASLLHGGFGPGEQALLGCVLSWSAYSLIGRSVLKTISPLASVCYSSIIGTLLLLFPAIRHGLFSELQAISQTHWFCLLYLGIFGTAIGFSIYYQGIKKIGASRAGIFINLVPLFALILSYLILGETMRSLVLGGGFLILVGVSLTNFQSKSARRL